MTTIGQFVLILAGPSVVALVLAAWRFTSDVYRGGTKWENTK